MRVTESVSGFSTSSFYEAAHCEWTGTWCHTDNGVPHESACRGESCTFMTGQSWSLADSFHEQRHTNNVCQRQDNLQCHRKDNRHRTPSTCRAQCGISIAGSGVADWGSVGCPRKKGQLNSCQNLLRPSCWHLTHHFLGVHLLGWSRCFSFRNPIHEAYCSGRTPWCDRSMHN